MRHRMHFDTGGLRARCKTFEDASNPGLEDCTDGAPKSTRGCSSVGSDVLSARRCTALTITLSFAQVVHGVGARTALGEVELECAISDHCPELKHAAPNRPTPSSLVPMHVLLPTHALIPRPSRDTAVSKL